MKFSVKPKKISLKSSNLENSEASVYHDGESVSFKEGDKRNFFCEVKNAYPVPSILIKLGDEDISDRFEKKIKLTRKISSKPHESKSFLNELSYDVALSAASLEITHEFDHQKLMCIVEYPENADDKFYHEKIAINVKLHGCKF